MSKFKVGDKVRCINDDRAFGIATGTTYTIENVVNWPPGAKSLALEGVNGAYYIERFELVDDKAAFQEAYAKMKSESPFKKGDLITCKKEGLYGITNPGVICTVVGENVNHPGHVYVSCGHEREPDCGFLVKIEHFELVQPVMDKSDRDLIKKLNGGTKHDSGKPDLSLLPFEQLEEVARILEFGKAKYGRLNWQKGINTTRLLGAAFRHLGKFSDGTDMDDESGQSHLAHTICNLLFLMWTMKHKPELDDRKD